MSTVNRKTRKAASQDQRKRQDAKAQSTSWLEPAAGGRCPEEEGWRRSRHFESSAQALDTGELQKKLNLFTVVVVWMREGGIASKAGARGCIFELDGAVHFEEQTDRRNN